MTGGTAKNLRRQSIFNRLGNTNVRQQIVSRIRLAHVSNAMIYEWKIFKMQN